MLGLRKGDFLNWICNDFDCVKSIKHACIVTEVYEDHALATTLDDIKPLTLWIDDDTMEMFEAIIPLNALAERR